MVQIVDMPSKPSWGQQISEILEPYNKMSLAQKMTRLQNQQEQQQRMSELSQMEKTMPGLGRAVFALGPQGATKFLSDRGPQEFSEIFAPESIRRQPMMQPQEEIPIQDREAIDEVPQEKSFGQKPKSIEDYIKEIDPRYDQRGPQQKEQIARQAERRFNSEMKLREESSRQEERIEKKQAPFIKEVRTKADAAKTILNAANNMEKVRSRGNLGVTSTARALVSPQVRADKAAYDTQASQFLSYYKALFPRGFTQQEFKHIESHWLPSSNNTDERNQAIEESFKDMAEMLVQKAEILDSLRDENGRLPSNAEQKVDQIMGGKIKDLQNKFTSTVPSGGKKEETSGMNELPKASDHSGKIVLDTKTGSKFRSNGKNWVKVD